MSRLGTKMTDEQRRNISKAMRRAHALKRMRRAAQLRNNQVVVDHIPNPMTTVATQYKAAQTHDAETRFPFAQYASTLKEAQGIIEARDQSGRNSYLEFWDGFPHGLSDITFETHRRVARILGVERQLANGFAHKADELTKVMRADLLDLANYALFGVMKLDKDSQELA